MTIHDLTIEQMREIVEGAPEGAIYFGGENGDCDYEKWIEVYFEIPQLHKINDLRTAIAEYDSRDFKVGDLVVFDTSKEFCAKLPHDLMSFRWRDDVDAIVSQDGRLFVVSYGALRKAETEEIKAGHRLNHIDDVTDMVTDIKNHLSPSTKVVDL